MDSSLGSFLPRVQILVYFLPVQDLSKFRIHSAHKRLRKFSYNRKAFLKLHAVSTASSNF